MKNGEVLELLRQAEGSLPSLIRTPEVWKTLDVNYDPPRVERLWLEWGDLSKEHEGWRIYLHRIHPCSEALFHPHPWPSAIKILSGKYEMAVGYGAGEQRPPTAATLILTAGSSYEMIDPDGWHYVKPLREPSLSIMVTGKPWGRISPGKNIKHNALSDEAKFDLLSTFGRLYNFPSTPNT